MLKLKNSNLSSTNFWSSFLMNQNAQLCHRIIKQQHPRPAHSSECSRSLPKWWSPRLGLGAVLAASIPLQVSKYWHHLYSANWAINELDILVRCITACETRVSIGKSVKSWVASFDGHSAHKPSLTNIGHFKPILYTNIKS